MKSSSKAAIALPVAMLAGVAILLAMPMAAERLVGALGAEPPPSAPTIETIYFLAIFVPLAIAGWLGGRLGGARPLALGRHAGRTFGLGLTIGLAGLAIAALHGVVAGQSSPGAGLPLAPGWFLVGTCLILLQTGAEEIYFRGWLQPILVGAWGASGGIIATAFAFAALHLVGGAMHPVAFFNLFLGGLLFGWLAWRWGGIAAALGAHFAWNWSEAMLLGLTPNPGVSSFGSFLDLDLSGPAYWGGTAEGLNSSIGMTAVLAAILLILMMPRQPGRNPPFPAAA